ncbi:MerR family transcriptional regulator [Bacillaceae bacterium Marseille-Q3522]|nr:MerR family transcriptional regulator [Bacillaceae bacterium Marseille-Q3522]
MQINEVMKLTGLTRKAIHYYDQIGLVEPAIASNGYRNYSELDVKRLQKIATLRQLDLPLEKIKEIVENPKMELTILQLHRHFLIEKEKRFLEKRKWLEHAIESVEKGEKYHIGKIDESFYEKLEKAFPGFFGKYLKMHFAAFGDIEINNAEKRAAYEEIVSYLDETEIELPSFTEELPDPDEKLAEAVQASYQKLFNMTDKEKLQHISKLKQQQEESLQRLQQTDPHVVEAYHSAKNKWGKLLSEKGYYEKVVKNLRILSPVFGQYATELERIQRLWEQQRNK